MAKAAKRTLMDMHIDACSRCGGVAYVHQYGKYGFLCRLCGGIRTLKELEREVKNREVCESIYRLVFLAGAGLIAATIWYTLQ